MTRILIVDDEELARKKIRRLLGECGMTPVIEDAVNGLEAVARLRSESFDLVFLDIDMPGMTGLEVLQNLEQRPFKIIFQTASDAFAIRAFEENACDYLLKPFDLDRFRKALEKALSQPPAANRFHEFEKGIRRPLSKISVKQGAKWHLIDVARIECFTSEDHYTILRSGTEEWVSDLSLSFLEERLDSGAFLRVHRGAILNLAHLKTFAGGPNATVETTSGFELPVSRANRQRVESLFNRG